MDSPDGRILLKESWQAHDRDKTHVWNTGFTVSWPVISSHQLVNCKWFFDNEYIVVLVNIDDNIEVRRQEDIGWQKRSRDAVLVLFDVSLTVPYLPSLFVSSRVSLRETMQFARFTPWQSMVNHSS